MSSAPMEQINYFKIKSTKPLAPMEPTNLYEIIGNQYILILFTRILAMRK